MQDTENVHRKDVNMACDLQGFMQTDIFHDYVTIQQVVIKCLNKHFCVYLEQVFGTVFAR